MNPCNYTIVYDNVFKWSILYQDSNLLTSFLKQAMRFYSIFQVQRLKDETEITLSSSVADIEYCTE